MPTDLHPTGRHHAKEHTMPSAIEWTDETWNPVTGCTKISSGCANCYAARMAVRLKAMGQHAYRNEFEVTIHPDRLDVPRSWRKPRDVFVNSMSDLFHEAVPDDFIRKVFDAMQDTPRHRFQVLTKRAQRLERLGASLPLPPHVWVGVSVEDQRSAWRIDHLRRVPAAVRFLSLEPLLGPLATLNLDGIHWVIVGGESGPGCRPMDPAWVRDIHAQCIAAGVPFFFKQWGGRIKKATGRELDGRTWDEMPAGQDHRKG